MARGVMSARKMRRIWASAEEHVRKLDQRRIQMRKEQAKKGEGAGGPRQCQKIKQ